MKKLTPHDYEDAASFYLLFGLVGPFAGCVIAFLYFPQYKHGILYGLGLGLVVAVILSIIIDRFLTVYYNYDKEISDWMNSYGKVTAVFLFAVIGAIVGGIWPEVFRVHSHFGGGVIGFLLGVFFISIVQLAFLSAFFFALFSVFFVIFVLCFGGAIVAFLVAIL